MQFLFLFLVSQTLAGHEAPIATLDISASSGSLASGSWDKTLKLWSLYESVGARETIDLNSEGLYALFLYSTVW